MAEIDPSQVILDIKTGKLFLEMGNMSGDELRKVYSSVVKLGPQDIGRESTDRTLNLVNYELNRQENRETFRQTRTLTWVAIGLSLVQAIIGTLTIWHK